MKTIKSYILYIFLFLIFFAISFCGSLKVGPLSLRNYATLVLLVVSIFASPKKSYIDATVRAFIWYLVILIFVNILNGCLNTSLFIKMMLGYQLPSIVIVLALPKLLRSRQDVLATMIVFTLLYLMNIAVTYGQFIGNGTAITISEIIGFDMSEVEGDKQLGSFLGGLLGNVVNNGYFLSSLLPLSVMGLWSKNRTFHILGYVVLALASYNIFIVQQRTAFVILILFFALLLFYKRDKLIMVMAVCLCVALLYNSELFSSMDTGRLTLEESNDDRLQLWDDFLRFAGSNDIILGGAQKYYSTGGGTQHNTFTSSFILGGIPVFVAFCWLLVRIFRTLNKYSKQVFQDEVYYVPLYFGCFAYFLCSLTHSMGIQNDGVLFWTLYGLILSLINTKNSYIQ